MPVSGTNLSAPAAVLLTEPPEGPHLKLRLDRSDAMYESERIAADVPASTTYYLPAPEGPWVQLTYEYVRSQDGEFPLAFHEGYWYGADGHPASDVVIEFVTPPQETS